MCGGAWIIRNCAGDTLFHSRDAFTPVTNRMAAELRCFVWLLRCFRDLHISNCAVWSDLASAVEAVNDTRRWPLYRRYLDQIHHLLQEIHGVVFYVSSRQANRIAQDIARSVTRDGRFKSYLSIGGPAWLQSRICEEIRARASI